ncbi:MAG TPA: 2-amino-4-hydroxy-6-hydroxymethyldihydropteridine diphosphokinase [bacterium]|nr:2-amino-4-hydroxy-6-hydroxymethyldihydropteridine diphosphokinase [bacterium]HPR87470.1 2-amino-4-hydroxy-6-hydroxymethyldihydropteridine diphosphokinase [bacterium]
MPPPATPEAYISLGANLGDREENLLRALKALEGDGVHLHRLSGIYETEPVGVTHQPDYLNMTAGITTMLPPLLLLARLLGIEEMLGRVRREHWGARTIDLDLLCYDDLTWQDEKLILPHPRLHERRFVLVPLAEIAAAYRVAGLNATVQELLQGCQDSHAVRLYSSAQKVQRRMRKAQA